MIYDNIQNQKYPVAIDFKITSFAEKLQKLKFQLFICSFHIINKLGPFHKPTKKCEIFLCKCGQNSCKSLSLLSSLLMF